MPTDEEQIYYVPKPIARGGTTGEASQFAMVLAKLANDKAYRDQAIRDPDMVARDYRLTLTDLKALREAAILSGVDVSRINSVRAAELARRATGEMILADVNISCCSCCCCCCGETAVASVMSG